MPDPKDPTPAKAVQRGGRWIVVGADERALKGQSGKMDEAAAKAVAARINRTWAQAKRERKGKGAPELTEGVWPLTGGAKIAERFDPARHPRNRVGRFRDVLERLSQAGHGSSVELPHGVRVRTHLGSLVVDAPGREPRRLNVPHVAAIAALHASEDAGGVEPSHRARLKELAAARKEALRAGDISAVQFVEQSMATSRKATGKPFHELPTHGRSQATLKAYSASVHSTPASVRRLASDLHSLRKSPSAAKADYHLPAASRLADQMRPRMLDGGNAVETGYGTYRLRPQAGTTGLYELVRERAGRTELIGDAGTRKAAELEIAVLHDDAMERWVLAGQKRRKDAYHRGIKWSPLPKPTFA